MPEAKSHCSLCRNEMDSGLWTNGDGFEDAKHVGIVAPEMRGFCWDCVRTRGAEIPDLAKQIQKAFAERQMCGFLQSWIGRCRELQPCAKHGGRICASCGSDATRDCEQTGQFVCGEDLCNECEHTIFPSGTNGGIGFNAESVPEGMKRHCKKSEQRYQPWYAKSQPIETTGQRMEGRKLCD